MGFQAFHLHVFHPHLGKIMIKNIVSIALYLLILGCTSNAQKEENAVDKSLNEVRSDESETKNNELKVDRDLNGDGVVDSKDKDLFLDYLSKMPGVTVERIKNTENDKENP